MLIEVPGKFVIFSQFLQELSDTNYFRECQFIAKILEVSVGKDCYMTLGDPYVDEQPEKVLQLELRTNDTEFVQGREGQYVVISSMYDSLVINQISVANAFILSNLQESLFTVDEDEVRIVFTSSLPYTGISISFAPLKQMFMNIVMGLKRLVPNANTWHAITDEIAERARF